MEILGSRALWHCKAGDIVTEGDNTSAYCNVQYLPIVRTGTVCLGDKLEFDLMVFWYFSSFILLATLAWNGSTLPNILKLNCFL